MVAQKALARGLERAEAENDKTGKRQLLKNKNKKQPQRQEAVLNALALWVVQQAPLVQGEHLGTPVGAETTSNTQPCTDYGLYAYICDGLVYEAH